MRKGIATLLALSLLLCTACSNQTAGQPDPQSSEADRPILQAPDVLEQTGTASNVPAEGQEANSKILIAYFTWAENTHVENPENVDVDATTSASVLIPGNAAKMAGWIQQEVGGDLFSIVVTEPYSSDYDECLDRAADEKAANARPKLVANVENIEDYDTVFIGYPNWWYSCPMAILSFIEENDLSGKKIVLFCTHGTGGLAGSVQDITAELPDDCTVEENVIGVYRNDVNAAQPAVLSWLTEIGY